MLLRDNLAKSIVASFPQLGLLNKEKEAHVSPNYFFSKCNYNCLFFVFSLQLAYFSHNGGLKSSSTGFIADRLRTINRTKGKSLRKLIEHLDEDNSELTDIVSFLVIII